MTAITTLDRPRLAASPGIAAAGAGLQLARQDPSGALHAIESADVRGRGGAHFPAARKWWTALTMPAPRVVVANAGEHEPGSIKDAHLLSTDPDLVMEGLAIAATVLEAARCHIVLAGRLAHLADGLRDAADRLGFDVDVVVGPDRYLVGEETALIEVLEGREPKPRFRPPLPGVKGFWSYPTVVQNIETLANVAWVLRSQAAGESTPVVDTFLWSVWGTGIDSVVGESRIGVPIGDVLAAAGIEEWKAVTLGGFSGGVVTLADAGIALDPASLGSRGLSMGCASFRVIGPGECTGAVAAEVLDFFASESCGQCVPCEKGLRDAAEVVSGGLTPTMSDLDDVSGYLGELRGRGVCKLPDGAAMTYLALWRAFRSEIVDHSGRRCECRR